jgi:nicotinate phosphoribosyltransferase
MSDALLTDLYQLTMLEAYHRKGIDAPAVFELYARRLPPNRGYLVVAGLELVLEYLEALAFSAADLDWLASLGRFSDEFLHSLALFRFHGDVWAVPEGTVLFAGEPWLRVEARLSEAQFIESRLINLMHFSTLIATKAVRCVSAAAGRPLVDFGMRRAHGAEAALHAARATGLVGFAGTATVEAGRRYGLPLSGTMAHSYVQALGDEREAFRHYAMTFPGAATLLIDTDDTATAAERVAELVREGVDIRAVRIDSGDLSAEARRVRSILDAGGATSVQIVVSGNLDEFSIAELVQADAPIDVFGVGTRLDTSADAPTIDAVYKLQSVGGRASRKRSPGKETWPGAKQVWRRHGTDGRACGDVVTLAHEHLADADPLLECVMQGGRRVRSAPTFASMADRVHAEWRALPDSARALRDPVAVPVTYSEAIVSLARELDAAST